jgi:hypothetical protein
MTEYRHAASKFPERISSIQLITALRKLSVTCRSGLGRAGCAAQQLFSKDSGLLNCWERDYPVAGEERLTEWGKIIHFQTLIFTGS